MNWKTTIALLFILGIFSFTRESKDFSRKNSESDSLDYFFEQANIDTLPYARRLLFTEKALAIVEKQPNDSMNRVNYFKVANRYWNFKEWNEYKEICILVISLSKKNQDEINLAKAYGYFGDYYKNTTVDSSYYYYNKSEKIYDKLFSNEEHARVLIQKAELQYLQRDYVGAEKSTYKALRNLKKTFYNKFYLPEIFNLLGNINSDLNEYDKAVVHYKQAIQELNNKDEHISSVSKAMVLNNIGILYERKRNFEEAILYYQSALKEKSVKFDRTQYANLKNNLAFSTFKSGDLNNADEFYQALRISDSLLDYNGMVCCRINLSEYNFALKNYILARNFSKEAYAQAKLSKLPLLLLSALNQLIKADKKNASKYSAEYYKFNDSLELIERLNRNKFARIEYETEELAQEKNNLIAQKQNYILTAIIVFLIIIAVSLLGFLIFKRRQIQLKQQKQKSKAEIYRLQLDQQQKIEEGRQIEKKRIAQELHDGVMGKLTSIRLNLFILNKKSDVETIERCLTRIDEIQAIEKEIRAIAYDLHNDVSGNLNADSI